MFKIDKRWKNWALSASWLRRTMDIFIGMHKKNQNHCYQTSFHWSKYTKNAFMAGSLGKHSHFDGTISSR